MSKNNQKNYSSVLILTVVLIGSVLVGLVLRSLLPATPVVKQPDGTTAEPVQTVQTEPPATLGSAVTMPQVQQELPTVVNLGYGLEITDSGNYAGMYMEDGSNEIISDVMMLIVLNNGEQDIQLAEITALCGGEEYHFTLTNLAAGQRAVLLEQERKPAAELTSAVLDTCALFQEPMDLYADVIQVSGLDGMVNVKNISDTDIGGEICVYYKYAAQDLLYGGITFRVRIEGGLKAGELRQIPAGHFMEEGSAVVQVTIHE